MSPLWPGRNGPAIDYISAPPAESWYEKRRRNVAILGATGSIGRNALAIVEDNLDDLRIFALAAGGNVELLARQAARFRPELLAVRDESLAEKLLQLLPGDYRPLVLHGAEGYARLSSSPDADLVVCAQSGAAGLPAALAAALAGKVIALANKEALVLAGGLLREICAHTGASILPLDSEHFAIFQCLSGRGQGIAKLVLTASGGPFRTLSLEEMRKVGPEEALRHPNWSMGSKITIDSATMMNKGLELIEACQLFGVQPERIEILVHPQSLVHSMVVFEDNSMLAQLGIPDMRGPIAACLLWPRLPKPTLPEPDLAAIGQLTFESPDPVRFPALDLARNVMEKRRPAKAPNAGVNSACVVMNAANEMAVELFLSGHCRFHEISGLVQAAMNVMADVDPMLSPDWKDQGEGKAALAVAIWRGMQELDQRSRSFVRSCVGRRSVIAP